MFTFLPGQSRNIAIRSERHLSLNKIIEPLPLVFRSQDCSSTATLELRTSVRATEKVAEGLLVGR